jgi:hypothetical protein
VGDAELVDMAVEGIGKCRSHADRCQGPLGEHSFYLFIDKRPIQTPRNAPGGLSIPISISRLSEPRLWRRVVAHFNSPLAPGTSSLARRAIDVALRFKADRAIRLAAVGPSSLRIFSILRAPVTLISRHFPLPPAQIPIGPARGKANGGGSCGGSGERRRADLAT